MGVIINEHGVFFARGVGGDEKVIVVMVAQVCEHTKTLICTLEIGEWYVKTVLKSKYLCFW